MIDAMFKHASNNYDHHILLIKKKHFFSQYELPTTNPWMPTAAAARAHIQQKLTNKLIGLASFFFFLCVSCFLSRPVAAVTESKRRRAKRDMRKGILAIKLTGRKKEGEKVRSLLSFFLSFWLPSEKCQKHQERGKKKK